MRLEFVLDYRNPYAYLAYTQVRTWDLVACEYTLVDAEAVAKRVLNQPTPQCPAKSRYAGIDSRRWATHYGVRLTPNRALLEAIGLGRFDGALLVQAGLAAQRVGTFEEVNAALFEAVWASDADLITASGRHAFLESRGISGDLWRLASEPAVAQRLAAQSQAVAKRGVFSVPTLFVDHEMFYGSAQLPFVQAELRRYSRAAEVTWSSG